jgi:16S rRNA (cytosine967-C5)-methyltransferase
VGKIQNPLEIAKILYGIYKIVHENASLKSLKISLPLSNNMYKIFEKVASISLENELTHKSEMEKVSILNAIPTFFINRLKPYKNLDFIKENLELSSNTFTVHIREREIFDKLRDKGVSIKEDNYVTQLYHLPLKFKKDLILSKEYKEGYVLIVDRGSSLIASLLNPQIDDNICDLCAAPGIKSSIMSHLSHYSARIIAIDFSKKRSMQAAKLFKFLNIKGNNLLTADGIKPPLREDTIIDKILIDAPCTGSGTFSNNPELKWRQNSAFLRQNTIVQHKLLESGINLLKSGGTLIYSTCSLYAEEGELQIINFLDRLKPIELPQWLSSSYKINNRFIPGSGRLFPSIHNTNGFFISIFRKK